MWVYRDSWGWFADNWDAIQGVIVAFATVGASLAAWIAARAAQRSASDTQKSVEIQTKAVEITEHQLKESRRPNFTATFRVNLDVLYLDLANGGGPATNIRLFKPQLVSMVPQPESLLASVLHDINNTSAFLHGIDSMRSGEALSIPIGRIDSQFLADELVKELGGMWMQGRRDFPVFEIMIGANDRYVTRRLYLDKTALLRVAPQSR